MSDKTLNLKNGLTYTGDPAARWFGVASRDLSADEAAALDPRQRRVVKQSGAWREPTKTELKAAEKAAEQAAADASADSGQEG